MQKKNEVLINNIQVSLEDEEYSLSFYNNRYYIKTETGTHTALAAKRDGKTHISYLGKTFIIEPFKKKKGSASQESSGIFKSPLPATVVEQYVSEGDNVTCGEKLVVIEAMKTQQTITAPFDGFIKKLPCKIGDLVNEGELLIEVSQKTSE